MRPFRDGDTEAYLRVLSNAKVRASLHLPAQTSRADAWQAMATMLGQWELRNHGQWALEERATSALVGRAGAHRPERDDWPGIEIGWALHPDFWGNGYATEAGRAAIDWVFANHDVDEVFSMILPENSASQAVARRLGFELSEVRVFGFFPAKKHGLWRLSRAGYVRAT